MSAGAGPGQPGLAGQCWGTTNSLQSSYNLINLPAQIKSGSTVKANYSYLSDGTKTKALNASSVGYDYAGSFTFSHASNGTRTLESVAFGGGRIRRTGNNAYAVDYYPFGKRHPNGLTQLAANRWRFSGKEEQDAAFGITYSDFGARFYDRSAAWTTIDPMAEKYYSISPYVYCNNNPIREIDPSGKNPFVLGGAAAAAFDFAAISLGIVTTGIILKKTADGHIRFKNWNPGYGWQGRQDRLSADETRNLQMKHQRNMKDNLPDPNKEEELTYETNQGNDESETSYNQYWYEPDF